MPRVSGWSRQSLVPFLISAFSEQRFQGVWAQIIDIVSGVVNADTSADDKGEDETFILPILDQLRGCISSRLGSAPASLVQSYSETLRKASALYRFDAGRGKGTTAPAIPEHSERVRYWAFDELIRLSSASSSHTTGKDEDRRIAEVAAPALVRRFEGALRSYVDDARLRGKLPLGR